MKFRNFYYILSLIFVFIIPTVILGFFVADRLSMLNLIYFSVGITIVGSLYDFWATKHGKKDNIWIWQFNKNDIIGIKFFDIPLEEYLFYLSTSFYVIFSWETFKYLSDGGAVLGVLIFVTSWSLFFIGLPYVLGDEVK